LSDNNQPHHVCQYHTLNNCKKEKAAVRFQSRRDGKTPSRAQKDPGERAKHPKMMATHSRNREKGDVYAWAHCEPGLSFNNQRKLERPFDEDYIGWKSLQMGRPPNLNAKEDQKSSIPLKLTSCWTGLLRAETGRIRLWEVLLDKIYSAISRPM
jgi:hypothetical protein